MSTAGKVLTVLSVLMLAVWIVMISAVAQLNANATKEISGLAEKKAKIVEDTARAQESAVATQAQNVQEQNAKDQRLRVYRIAMSTAERQLATARQTLSRVQLQLESYNKALATAKENLSVRGQEKTDLETAKADRETLVKKTQGENEELLAQLKKLRDDFMDTLRKNTAATRSMLDGKSGLKAASIGR